MAPDTLFFPFEQDILRWPEKGERTAYLNARPHRAVSHVDFVQQFFKPDAAALMRAGLPVSAELPELIPAFDFVYLLLPKNQSEAEFFCATALGCLKEGGMLVAAADNKAGGARIEKMFKAFGLHEVSSLSKHKARVCWAVKKNVAEEALGAALEAGAVRDVLGGHFKSQPGIFGWDKIDRGSDILLQHVPKDLKGIGADFGCGYGFLSCAVVRQKNVSVLYCIDADYRAVEVCKMNVAAQKPAAKTEFLWADLCAPVKLPPLDFVVMNPPFHEGKMTDVSIGIDFIRSAHGALKTGGKLWMVANTQLPYEEILQGQFSGHEKKFEGAGFKVFCATK
jgi:16S rRNA (guanine1207-N2)-methyltransferase